jgi:membrane protein implicated in regulation of membrane protease activity
MRRYVLAVVLFFLLVGGASAAVIAAGAPAPAQIAFLVLLGLFVAAIVDAVAERRSNRPRQHRQVDRVASPTTPGHLLHETVY